MTDDILRQQDGQGNNDSDIRMRNGSDWYAPYPDPNNLTDLIGAPTLADHDRRLLEEYEAFALKCYNSDDMGIMSLDDVITAFLAQREGK